MGKQTDSVRAKLPIIRCKCGAEFLLLPDLAEMSLVVQRHAQTHKETVENPVEAERVYTEIEEFLTVQILRKASQIG